MADPTGEADKDALRLDFDRRLLLQFCGSAITSDAGLLPYGELDDAVGLTETAADTLADGRTGKNGRHRVDPAVMPHLRRQRRPPPAPRSCLQPWQFHADAGDAEDGGAVVADQPAREADQDRREGRQPWPHVTFQLAEVAVPRQMFADILSLIARLRAPPHRHDRTTGSDATNDGRGAP